ARIISEISSAILFLHSSHPEKIVHGGLKPENILLQSDLRCRLSDYGIFRLVTKEILRCPSFCRYYEPKGAFPYTDPEFHRTGILTLKSDVYSLGVVILQLLTGKPPEGLAADIRRAVLFGNLASVIDHSAGDWPTSVVEKLVRLGLRFCEPNSRDQPELTPAVVWELQQLHTSEERPIPSYFLCPILQEIMHHPVIAADGFTYEAEALRGWLVNGRGTSPMTNLRLNHLLLTPNHILRLAIQEWLCR
ncbi:U-box domain-containing protein, partial [Drosera capensis]